MQIKLNPYFNITITIFTSETKTGINTCQSHDLLLVPHSGIMINIHMQSMLHMYHVRTTSIRLIIVKLEIDNNHSNTAIHAVSNELA